MAIVETGTFLGTSTEWFCSFQAPVWSCEASESYFGFSRQRLKSVPNANLVLADSRTALREVLDGPLKSAVHNTILFYLDAHWEDDLPLADEIDIIFAACPRAVVLIDDFEVPGDTGYSYDDYGPGKALTAEYVAPSLDKFGLVIMYPKVSSDLETGAKRGCAVLTRKAMVHNILGAVSLLRSPIDADLKA
ncbi:hypothetical protein EF888_06170 [Silicimonas algicola]|uniref:hypothetical protein n=1 Tax=Silicimonas algicola TaxID=1826607 RepID=UPI000F857505|nr:hypothetical protein [Silicimonas algicola]AZQ66761.1 hypothetical protein EF888_06170 [Silicimonas algicola]